MFFLDPSGNALEIKAMARPGEPVREVILRAGRRADQSKPLVFTLMTSRALALRGSGGLPLPPSAGA